MDLVMERYNMKSNISENLQSFKFEVFKNLIIISLKFSIEFKQFKYNIDGLTTYLIRK